MKDDEPGGFVSRGVAPRLGLRALGRVPASLTPTARPARFLYVVARDRPDLYAALRENFLESTRLGIVLDRRARASFFSRPRAPAAIGIACFGPLDLGAGVIAETPKPGWSGVDVAGAFRRALGVPIAIDTDVNGAALGEWRWGAGAGCDPL